jgi:hypothetical protein
MPIISKQMAKTAQIPQSRAAIDQCLAALGTAGLVHGRGQARYELHPALTGFLRSRLPVLGADTETEAWRRAFVDTLRRLHGRQRRRRGGGDGSAPGRQPDGGANRCRGS